MPRQTGWKRAVGLSDVTNQKGDAMADTKDLALTEPEWPAGMIKGYILDDDTAEIYLVFYGFRQYSHE